MPVVLTKFGLVNELDLLERLHHGAFDVVKRFFTTQVHVVAQINMMGVHAFVDGTFLHIVGCTRIAKRKGCLNIPVEQRTTTRDDLRKQTFLWAV